MVYHIMRKQPSIVPKHNQYVPQVEVVYINHYSNSSVLIKMQSKRKMMNFNAQNASSSDRNVRNIADIKFIP